MSTATTTASRPPMPAVDPRLIKMVQTWDHEIPYPKDTRQLVIDRKSFEDWIDVRFPEFKDLPATSELPKPNGRGVIHVDDNWYFCRRQLPVFEWVQEYWPWGALRGNAQWRKSFLEMTKQGKKWGVATFVEPVVIPVLGQYEFGRMNAWMSLTPNEIMTQRMGIRAAKGRVLVGGLGMGWLAQEIRQKKGVKEVVVVEKEGFIARFFGDSLKKKPGCPVKVVVGDVYEYANRHLSEFDSMLLDIWLRLGQAAYDKKFLALKKDFAGRIWGWGDYACHA